MSKKVALITGITGQTGSYLAEYLLNLDYDVHGIVRRSSILKTDRIDHIFDKITLHFGDMTDGMNLMHIMQVVKPDEVYNLAAQSHVAVSFETPEYTANADALGTLRMLEIIATHHPLTKFYQASTSELYGDSLSPQNEDTPFRPRSPYAAAKLYAYWLTRNYREAYRMYAVNGILFNHESPRRGETFVTRKITRHVANHMIHGLPKTPLQLGNVHAVRDWSHANDMVDGIYKMMQQKVPAQSAKDYVLGSDKGTTVLDFLHMAYSFAGIQLYWSDKKRKGIDANTGDILVEENSNYFRPLEVESLISDSSAARKDLGWKPTITLYEMIREMIQHDCKILSSSSR